MRNREHGSNTTNISVCQLDCRFHMASLWMPEQRLQALCVAIVRLRLYGHAFAAVSDHEIELHPAVLAETAEVTSRLGEDVCHEVLIDGTVIAQQVACENIALGPIFQTVPCSPYTLNWLSITLPSKGSSAAARFRHRTMMPESSIH